MNSTSHKTGIIPTKPGTENFHLFDSITKEIYPSDNIRHKQKEGFNSEFLHSCFVYMKNGKPLARLALYFNPFLRFENLPVACIGNFESINDPQVAHELISHAEDIARENGFKFMLGPMNGSTWDNYRFSTHHNHPNFFLEPYHHLYYNDLFQSCGYEPAAKYFTMRDRTMNDDKPKIKQRAQQFIEHGIIFRNIRTEDYLNELKAIHEFSMDAFRNNFLFTPVAQDTFVQKYLPLRPAMKKENVLIAEDNGKIAGLVFCVDDFYSEEPVLILKTLARNGRREYAGLGNVLGNMITKYARENGYKAILHAFIIDTNVSHELSKDYDGEEYKNYVLYGKKI